MDTLIVFTSFFLLLGWCIYYLIRYTATTVGDDSPLQREVSYHYEASAFLRWTNSPLLGFVCLIMGWGCWQIVAAMPPTTRFWYYPILLIFVGVSLGSFYLFSQLVRLEINLWTMIRGTTVLADPATKSITVQRAGTPTVLKADTIAFIEGHLTKQERLRIIIIASSVSRVMPSVSTIMVRGYLTLSKLISKEYRAKRSCIPSRLTMYLSANHAGVSRALTRTLRAILGVTLQR